MNDYIAQEIAADPDSSSWSALAEAQIYASYGETYRAMRALKRALPYAATASIKSIPLAYWRILFPEAVVGHDQGRVGKERSRSVPGGFADSPGVGVQSLGHFLRQCLWADAAAASVGKAMAREEGMSHFETFQLLDPETNIRLGTRYLRQMLDKFGGVQEYALAAYNAGDSAWWTGRPPDLTAAWTSLWSRFRSPQTREYVEAILRNEETYRAIDACCRFAGPEARAHEVRRRDSGHRYGLSIDCGPGIPFDTPGIRFRLTCAPVAQQH